MKKLFFVMIMLLTTIWLIFVFYYNTPKKETEFEKQCLSTLVMIYDKKKPDIYRCPVTLDEYGFVKCKANEHYFYFIFDSVPHRLGKRNLISSDGIFLQIEEIYFSSLLSILTNNVEVIEIKMPQSSHNFEPSPPGQNKW